MASRNFALIVGVAYLIFGVLGFVPGLLSPPSANAPHLVITAFYGYLLGLFPVNFVHNLIHLAVGAWGVAAARSGSGASAYAKTVAILYGVLAVMGFLPPFNTTFGLAPIHGHDIWLHAVTAIVAAYFGWFSTRHTATAAGKATAH